MIKINIIGIPLCDLLGCNNHNRSEGGRFGHNISAMHELSKTTSVSTQSDHPNGKHLSLLFSFLRSFSLLYW